MKAEGSPLGEWWFGGWESWGVSDKHRRRRAGLSFVASAVKAQQGEPPRQFVRSATLLSQGAAAPQHRGGCSELHQIKSTQRQKLHSDTVTVLIYPACLWVLLPLKQLATVFLLFLFSPSKWCYFSDSAMKFKAEEHKCLLMCLIKYP